jgi:dsRNA-specific ribonuclease
MDQQSRKIAGFIKKYIAPIVVAMDESGSVDQKQEIQKYRTMMYQPNVIPIWITALTHPSINPNPNENYEFYEFQGDKLMSSIFAQYIKERFPDILESEASRLLSHYLKTEEQAKLSRRIGLPQLLIAEQPRTLANIPNIQEDVLESFFGALFKVVDEYISSALSYLFCRNLFIYLFNQVHIDFDIAYGDPKTRVKEIFQDLGGGDRYINSNVRLTQIDYRKGHELYQFVMYLNDDMFNKVATIYPGLTNKVLADVKGKTQSETEAAGYRQVLKQLKIYGITIELLSKIKREVKGVTIEVVEQATEKAKSQGFNQIYFPKQSYKLPFTQLIGVEENTGRRQILVTQENNNRPTKEIRESLLQEYISQ